MSTLEAMMGLPQPELLADLYTFWNQLPFLLVLVGHCLFCASLAPEFKDRFVVHYMLTHLWGFGGGIVTAFIIRDPKVAPLAFLTDNRVGITWTICWWLVNYAPFGIVERVHKQWYIRMVTKSCTSLMRAKLILARVDLAVRIFPGVAAAPLLLGTLGGCGGRLLCDLVKHGWSRPEHPVNAELSNPAWVSRSAFLAAAVYYLGAYHFALVPPEQLAGLILTLKMVHSYVSDLTGSPLDVTEPISAALLRISNVPHPALAMAGGPSSGNAAAKRAPTPAKAAATPVKSTTTSIQLTASPAAPASSGGSPLNVRRSSRLRQKVQ